MNPWHGFISITYFCYRPPKLKAYKHINNDIAPKPRQARGAGGAAAAERAINPARVGR
jgi:hypothetical protein